MKRLFAIFLSMVLVAAFSVVSVSASAPDEGSPESAPPSEDQEQEEVQEPGMEEATLELGKTFLSGVWGLFGVTVPGFNFTFGQMWLGVFLCSLSLLVIKLLFGFGGSGDTPRTSSTNNPKISDKRKGDEF